MFHLDRLKAENLKRKREKQQHDTLEGSSSTTAITDKNGSRRLLPGIPHDLTVRMICPRLPLRSVGALSTVSHAWHLAVRSQEVYDERARFHSTTETFVVLNHTVSVSENKFGIVLYSLRTGACRELPPISYVKNGIPDCCQCTTLDGKIYIMGGLKNNSRNDNHLCQEDVYMFNVGGHAQTWKKCASMHRARYRFGCGIIDGKIYVCGGCKSYSVANVSDTEVYDPKADAWTELMPMISGRKGHTVTIVDNELLVYGGRLLSGGHVRNYYFQIYNPTTGKWRGLPNQAPNDPEINLNVLPNLVVPPQIPNLGVPPQIPNIPGMHIDDTFKMFSVEGKLHAITGSAVFQLDLEQDVTTRVQSIKQRKRNHWTPYTPEKGPRAVLAVDDQFLAVDSWYEYQYIGRRVEIDRYGDLVFALLRGTGFGVKDQNIVWERVLYSLSFEGLKCPFLHILRL